MLDRDLTLQGGQVGPESIRGLVGNVAAGAGEVRLVEDDRAASRVAEALRLRRERRRIDGPQLGLEVLRLRGLDQEERACGKDGNQQAWIHEVGALGHDEGT